MLEYLKTIETPIIVALITASLLFLGTTIAAFLGFINTRKQLRDAHLKLESDIDKDLRQDLMKLYEDQSEQISKLNQDYLNMRESNAHIIEQNEALRNELSEEKQRFILVNSENKQLRFELDVMREDKARLANRVMILESELQALRKTVEKNYNEPRTT